MITLTDPVRVEGPSRGPVTPVAPLDNPVHPAPKLEPGGPAERTFEIESPNGTARTVVGTIESLDEVARAYVVRTRTGSFARVPLRDITREHGSLLEARG